MKLIDEIVELLSGSKPNLTDALIKTKVLLHKLGRPDLAGWVNQELNGYGSSDVVPPYRMIHAHVRGDVVTHAARYSNYQLPTMHLEQKVRARFEDIDVRDSIAGLEMVTGKDSGRVYLPIPPEANHLFAKALTDGAHVERCWSDIGVGQMHGILTQVRSRLLDFVLELSEKVGDADLSDADVRLVGQSPEMSSMFNNAIFGDNVTITVGNHNVQSVSNKGDFGGLANLLKSNDVSVADVEALRTAIDQDVGAPELQRKQFGPSVRAWMGNMLSKAANAAWTVELSIAANFLTEGLKAYYGWLVP